jgi:hypothetical protein
VLFSKLSAAELIEIMDGHGFDGRVVAERAADEEFLQILHFKRRSRPASS